VRRFTDSVQLSGECRRKVYHIIHSLPFFVSLAQLIPDDVDSGWMLDDAVLFNVFTEFLAMCNTKPEAISAAMAAQVTLSPLSFCRAWIYGDLSVFGDVLLGSDSSSKFGSSSGSDSSDDSGSSGMVTTTSRVADMCSIPTQVVDFCVATSGPKLCRAMLPALISDYKSMS
jgi:hypothetical protein